MPLRIRESKAYLSVMYHSEIKVEFIDNRVQKYACELLKKESEEEEVSLFKDFFTSSTVPMALMSRGRGFAAGEEWM